MEADTLRCATASDLPQILELMRGYYRDDGLEFDELRAAATVARLLAEPQWGCVLLLESQDTAVGYVAICLGFSLELGGNDAFIDELFVLPEHRGRGHGRRLVESAAAQAQLRGVRALHLEVDRNNTAARELYTSLGYGLRDRYYVMTLPLRCNDS